MRRLFSVLALLLTAIAAPLQASSSGNSGSSALSQTAANAQLSEAERQWQAAVQKNPQDAAAFASLGLVFSREGKFPEAVRAYKKALALDSTLPGIQLNLGLAEFKQGNFTAAIAPLSAALAADPQSAQARTLLGISYYGAKKFAEASEQLAQVSKLDPSNVELHRMLAQSCLWAKKYDCALEEYRQVELHEPDSAAAHLLRGEALDGLARTPEALVEFEAAARIAPREPDVNFGVGYLQWKLANYDEPRKSFENELAVDPSHPQALAYLADIELRNNEPDKALPLLQKVVKQRNDIRIAYVNLGAILTQQKRYQEAAKALQRAITLDPSQPDAHFRLGRLEQAMGNMAAAEKEFAKVRELHEKQNDDVASKMAAPKPQVPQ
jgi:tetratricopeptide (TPR) repeat protein